MTPSIVSLRVHIAIIQEIFYKRKDERVFSQFDYAMRIWNTFHFTDQHFLESYSLRT